MDVAIRTHDGPPPAEPAAVVDAGLGAANDAAAALHEVRGVSAFAHAADGRVIGGAVGLGWAERFAWGTPGTPRGIGLDGGGVSIVIAERHAADDHSKSHGIEGVRPTVHLVVGDLDARHAALAAKGPALFAPEVTHWGVRWFVVRDPDGNPIAFEEARHP